MCIHESVNTPEFKALESALNEKYGLVAITMVQETSTGKHLNFSMFVNPKEPICIRRAVHDLRTWHPLADGFSEQSEMRIANVLGIDWFDVDLNDIEPIDGRIVPDSLDLDETNVESVYQRCLENGYVNASPPQYGETTPVIATVAEAAGGFLGNVLRWVKNPFRSAA